MLPYCPSVVPIVCKAANANVSRMCPLCANANVPRMCPSFAKVAHRMVPSCAQLPIVRCHRVPSTDRKVALRAKLPIAGFRCVPSCPSQAIVCQVAYRKVPLRDKLPITSRCMPSCPYQCVIVCLCCQSCAYDLPMYPSCHIAHRFCPSCAKLPMSMCPECAHRVPMSKCPSCANQSCAKLHIVSACCPSLVHKVANCVPMLVANHVQSFPSRVAITCQVAYVKVPLHAYVAQRVVRLHYKLPVLWVPLCAKLPIEW